jgi:regulator of protease activity HflC (stomatin/prohibitin superfamily)
MDNYDRPIPKLPIFGGIAIVLLIIFAVLSITRVPEGTRGVMTVWGKNTGRILTPGLNFHSPLGVRVVKMNVRTVKFTETEPTATKDLQEVTAIITGAYHLNPSHASRVFSEHGTDYEHKLVLPGVIESIKATTAQFSADELVSRRGEVSNLIQEAITQKLKANGIIADEVNIENFKFSPSYREKIDQKVAAEQEAQTEQNRLAVVTAQAAQAIEEARGKAEAIRITAQALRESPDILALKRIEMMETKWNGVMPRVVGTDGMSLLMTTD